MANASNPTIQDTKNIAPEGAALLPHQCSINSEVGHVNTNSKIDTLAESNPLNKITGELSIPNTSNHMCLRQVLPDLRKMRDVRMAVYHGLNLDELTQLTQDDWVLANLHMLVRRPNPAVNNGKRVNKLDLAIANLKRQPIMAVRPDVIDQFIAETFDSELRMRDEGATHVSYVLHNVALKSMSSGPDATPEDKAENESACATAVNVSDIVADAKEEYPGATVAVPAPVVGLDSITNNCWRRFTIHSKHMPNETMTLPKFLKWQMPAWTGPYSVSPKSYYSNKIKYELIVWPKRNYFHIGPSDISKNLGEPSEIPNDPEAEHIIAGHAEILDWLDYAYDTYLKNEARRVAELRATAPVQAGLSRSFIEALDLQYAKRLDATRAVALNKHVMTVNDLVNKVAVLEPNEKVTYKVTFTKVKRTECHRLFAWQLFGQYLSLLSNITWLAILDQDGTFERWQVQPVTEPINGCIYKFGDNCTRFHIVHRVAHFPNVTLLLNEILSSNVAQTTILSRATTSANSASTTRPKLRLPIIGYNGAEATLQSTMAERTTRSGTDKALAGLDTLARKQVDAVVKRVEKNRTEYVPYMDEIALENLRKGFPSVNLVPSPDVEIGHHPIHRTSRKLVTQAIWETFPTQNLVVDIGGDFYSHIKLGHYNVHSCFKVGTALDESRYMKNVMRLAKLKEIRAGFEQQPRLKDDKINPEISNKMRALNAIGTSANMYYCSKAGQDCPVRDTNRYTLAMSVDVLHYLTPTDLALIFANHNIGIMYSAVTVPPGFMYSKKGKNAYDEGWWEVVNDTLLVNFDQDSVSYAQSAQLLKWHLTTPIIKANNFAIFRRIVGVTGVHTRFEHVRVSIEKLTAAIFRATIYLTSNQSQQLVDVPIINAESRNLLGMYSFKTRRMLIDEGFLERLKQRLMVSPEPYTVLAQFAQGQLSRLHTEKSGTRRYFNISVEDARYHCVLALMESFNLGEKLRPLLEQITENVNDMDILTKLTTTLSNFGKQIATDLDPTTAPELAKFFFENSRKQNFEFRRTLAATVETLQNLKEISSWEGYSTVRTTAAAAIDVDGPDAENIEAWLATGQRGTHVIDLAEPDSYKVAEPRRSANPQCSHIQAGSNVNLIVNWIVADVATCNCCGLEANVWAGNCYMCANVRPCYAECSHGQHVVSAEHCCGKPLTCRCIRTVTCTHCHALALTNPCLFCLKPVKPVTRRNQVEQAQAVQHGAIEELFDGAAENTDDVDFLAAFKQSAVKRSDASGVNEFVGKVADQLTQAKTLFKETKDRKGKGRAVDDDTTTTGQTASHSKEPATQPDKVLSRVSVGKVTEPTIQGALLGEPIQPIQPEKKLSFKETHVETIVGESEWFNKTLINLQPSKSMGTWIIDLPVEPCKFVSPSVPDKHQHRCTICGNLYTHVHASAKQPHPLHPQFATDCKKCRNAQARALNWLMTKYRGVLTETEIMWGKRRLQNIALDLSDTITEDGEYVVPPRAMVEGGLRQVTNDSEKKSSELSTLAVAESTTKTTAERQRTGTDTTTPSLVKPELGVEERVISTAREEASEVKVGDQSLSITESVIDNAQIADSAQATVERRHHGDAVETENRDDAAMGDQLTVSHPSSTHYSPPTRDEHMAEREDAEQVQLTTTSTISSEDTKIPVLEDGRAEVAAKTPLFKADSDAFDILRGASTGSVPMAPVADFDLQEACLGCRTDVLTPVHDGLCEDCAAEGTICIDEDCETVERRFIPKKSILNASGKHVARKFKVYLCGHVKRFTTDKNACTTFHVKYRCMACSTGAKGKSPQVKSATDSTDNEDNDDAEPTNKPITTATGDNGIAKVSSVPDPKRARDVKDAKISTDSGASPPNLTVGDAAELSSEPAINWEDERITDDDHYRSLLTMAESYNNIKIWMTKAATRDLIYMTKAWSKLKAPLDNPAAILSALTTNDTGAMINRAYIRAAQIAWNEIPSALPKFDVVAKTTLTSVNLISKSLTVGRTPEGATSIIDTTGAPHGNFLFTNHVTIETEFDVGGDGDCGVRAIQYLMPGTNVPEELEALGVSQEWMSAANLATWAIAKGVNLIIVLPNIGHVVRSNGSNKYIAIHQLVPQHWIPCTCVAMDFRADPSWDVTLANAYTRAMADDPNITDFKPTLQRLQDLNTKQLQTIARHIATESLLEMMPGAQIAAKLNFTLALEGGTLIMTRKTTRVQLGKAADYVFTEGKLKIGTHPTGWGKTVNPWAAFGLDPKTRVLIITPSVATVSSAISYLMKTYPDDLFYGRAGERNWGNCGPAANTGWDKAAYLRRDRARYHIMTIDSVAYKLQGGSKVWLDSRQFVILDETHTANANYLRVARGLPVVHALASATMSNNRLKLESRHQVDLRIYDQFEGPLANMAKQGDCILICPTINFGRQFNKPVLSAATLKKTPELMNASNGVATTAIEFGVTLNNVKILVDSGYRLDIDIAPVQRWPTADKLKNLFVVRLRTYSWNEAVQTMGRVGRVSGGLWYGPMPTEHRKLTLLERLNLALVDPNTCTPQTVRAIVVLKTLGTRPDYSSHIQAVARQTLEAEEANRAKRLRQTAMPVAMEAVLSLAFEMEKRLEEFDTILEGLKSIKPCVVHPLENAQDVVKMVVQVAARTGGAQTAATQLTRSKAHNPVAGLLQSRNDVSLFARGQCSKCTNGDDGRLTSRNEEGQWQCFKCLGISAFDADPTNLNKWELTDVEPPHPILVDWHSASAQRIIEAVSCHGKDMLSSYMADFNRAISTNLKTLENFDGRIFRSVGEKIRKHGDQPGQWYVLIDFGGKFEFRYVSDGSIIPGCKFYYTHVNSVRQAVRTLVQAYSLDSDIVEYAREALNNAQAITGVPGSGKSTTMRGLKPDSLITTQINLLESEKNAHIPHRLTPNLARELGGTMWIDEFEMIAPASVLMCVGYAKPTTLMITGDSRQSNDEYSNYIDNWPNSGNINDRVEVRNKSYRLGSYTQTIISNMGLEIECLNENELPIEYVLVQTVDVDTIIKHHKRGLVVVGTNQLGQSLRAALPDGTVVRTFSKARGSEYDHVTVVVSDMLNCTIADFYVAVTRHKVSLTLICATGDLQNPHLSWLRLSMNQGHYAGATFTRQRGLIELLNQYSQAITFRVGPVIAGVARYYIKLSTVSREIKDAIRRWVNSFMGVVRVVCDGLETGWAIVESAINTVLEPARQLAQQQNTINNRLPSTAADNADQLPEQALYLVERYMRNPENFSAVHMLTKQLSTTLYYQSHWHALKTPAMQSIETILNSVVELISRVEQQVHGIWLNTREVIACTRILVEVNDTLKTVSAKRDNPQKSPKLSTNSSESNENTRCTFDSTEPTTETGDNAGDMEGIRVIGDSPEPMECYPDYLPYDRDSWFTGAQVIVLRSRVAADNSDGESKATLHVESHLLTVTFVADCGHELTVTQLRASQFNSRADLLRMVENNRRDNAKHAAEDCYCLSTGQPSKDARDPWCKYVDWPICTQCQSLKWSLRHARDQWLSADMQYAAALQVTKFNPSNSQSWVAKRNPRTGRVIYVRVASGEGKFVPNHGELGSARDGTMTPTTSHALGSNQNTRSGNHIWMNTLREKAQSVLVKLNQITVAQRSVRDALTRPFKSQWVWPCDSNRHPATITLTPALLSDIRTACAAFASCVGAVFYVAKDCVFEGIFYAQGSTSGLQLVAMDGIVQNVTQLLIEAAKSGMETLATALRRTRSACKLTLPVSMHSGLCDGLRWLKDIMTRLSPHTLSIRMSATKTLPAPFRDFQRAMLAALTQYDVLTETIKLAATNVGRLVYDAIASVGVDEWLTLDITTASAIIAQSITNHPNQMNFVIELEAAASLIDDVEVDRANAVSAILTCAVFFTTASLAQVHEGYAYEHIMQWVRSIRCDEVEDPVDLSMNVAAFLPQKAEYMVEGLGESWLALVDAYSLQLAQCQWYFSTNFEQLYHDIEACTRQALWNLRHSIYNTGATVERAAVTAIFKLIGPDEFIEHLNLNPATELVEEQVQKVQLIAACHKATLAAMRASPFKLALQMLARACVARLASYLNHRQVENIDDAGDDLPFLEIVESRALDPTSITNDEAVDIVPTPCVHCGQHTDVGAGHLACNILTTLGDNEMLILTDNYILTGRPLALWTPLLDAERDLERGATAEASNKRIIATNLVFKQLAHWLSAMREDGCDANDGVNYTFAGMGVDVPKLGGLSNIFPRFQLRFRLAGIPQAPAVKRVQSVLSSLMKGALSWFSHIIEVAQSLLTNVTNYTNPDDGTPPSDPSSLNTWKRALEKLFKDTITRCDGALSSAAETTVRYVKMLILAINGFIQQVARGIGILDEQPRGWYPDADFKNRNEELAYFRASIKLAADNIEPSLINMKVMVSETELGWVEHAVTCDECNALSVMRRHTNNMTRWMQTMDEVRAMKHFDKEALLNNMDDMVGEDGKPLRDSDRSLLSSLSVPSDFKLSNDSPKLKACLGCAANTLQHDGLCGRCRMILQHELEKIEMVTNNRITTTFPAIPDEQGGDTVTNNPIGVIDTESVYDDEIYSPITMVDESSVDPVEASVTMAEPVLHQRAPASSQVPADTKPNSSTSLKMDEDLLYAACLPVPTDDSDDVQETNSIMTVQSRNSSYAVMATKANGMVTADELDKLVDGFIVDRDLFNSARVVSMMPAVIATMGTASPAGRRIIQLTGSSVAVTECVFVADVFTPRVYLTDGGCIIAFADRIGSKWAITSSTDRLNAAVGFCEALRKRWEDVVHVHMHLSTRSGPGLVRWADGAGEQLASLGVRASRLPINWTMLHQAARATVHEYTLATGTIFITGPKVTDASISIMNEANIGAGLVIERLAANLVEITYHAQYFDDLCEAVFAKILQNARALGAGAHSMFAKAAIGILSLSVGATATAYYAPDAPDAIRKLYARVRNYKYNRTSGQFARAKASGTPLVIGYKPALTLNWLSQPHIKSKLDIQKLHHRRKRDPIRLVALGGRYAIEVDLVGAVVRLFGPTTDLDSRAANLRELIRDIDYIEKRFNREWYDSAAGDATAMTEKARYVVYRDGMLPVSWEAIKWQLPLMYEDQLMGGHGRGFELRPDESTSEIEPTVDTTGDKLYLRCVFAASGVGKSVARRIANCGLDHEHSADTCIASAYDSNTPTIGEVIDIDEIMTSYLSVSAAEAIKHPMSYRWVLPEYRKAVQQLLHNREVKKDPILLCHGADQVNGLAEILGITCHAQFRLDKFTSNINNQWLKNPVVGTNMIQLTSHQHFTSVVLNFKAHAMNQAIATRIADPDTEEWIRHKDLRLEWEYIMPQQGSIKMRDLPSDLGHQKFYTLGAGPTLARPVYIKHVAAVYNGIATRLYGNIAYRKERVHVSERVTWIRDAFGRANWEQLINEFQANPIKPSPEATAEWLINKGKPENQLSLIKRGVDDFMERQSFSDMNIHMKKELLMKGNLAPIGPTQARAINWHPKHYLAVICPMINEAKKRFKMLMDETKFVYTDGMTIAEMNQSMATLPTDCNIVEMDRNKQDKQTDAAELELEHEFLRLLGIPLEFAKVWVEHDDVWRWRAEFGIKGVQTNMRKTGGEMTSLGNLIVNAGFLADLARFYKIERAYALGDDSLLFTHEQFSEKACRKISMERHNCTIDFEQGRCGKFLQLLVSPTPNGYRCVGNIERLLDKASVGYDTTEENIMDKLKSYLHLLGYHPLLRDAFLALGITRTPYLGTDMHTMTNINCAYHKVDIGIVEYWLREFNAMVCEWKINRFSHDLTVMGMTRRPNQLRMLAGMRAS